MEEKGLHRCSWCNGKNPIYVKYHDGEWGVPTHDDGKIFELFVLEPMQAGLSWEIILNKRENFRRALDGFDAEKIAKYGEDKLDSLRNDKGIIRNERKLCATVKNARVFLDIKREYGSFSKYLWSFAGGEVIHEWDKTSSPVSDKISDDLRARGCSFMGSTVVYSLLQAVGIINSHEPSCHLYQENQKA